MAASKPALPSALTVVLPGLVDHVDDVVRHRDVVELCSHVVTLGIGPVEELQRFGNSLRVIGVLAWTRMKVAAVIGQLSSPGWLVRIR